MLQSVERASISVDGLFLNADSGFDIQDFRSYCYANGNTFESQTVFDDLLYKTHFVIERRNAWLDAFKTVLVRFDTNQFHWKALNLLAFTMILLRKL